MWQTIGRTDASFIQVHLSLGLCVIGEEPFILFAVCRRKFQSKRVHALYVSHRDRLLVFGDRAERRSHRSAELDLEEAWLRTVTAHVGACMCRARQSVPGGRRRDGLQARRGEYPAIRQVGVRIMWRFSWWRTSEQWAEAPRLERSLPRRTSPISSSICLSCSVA